MLFSLFSYKLPAIEPFLAKSTHSSIYSALFHTIPLNLMTVITNNNGQFQFQVKTLRYGVKKIIFSSFLHKEQSFFKSCLVGTNRECMREQQMQKLWFTLPQKLWKQFYFISFFVILWLHFVGAFNIDWLRLWMHWIADSIFDSNRLKASLRSTLCWNLAYFDVLFGNIWANVK